MRKAVAVALLFAVLGVLPRSAEARKRSIAVLEFRQGVSALPWFADRMAKRLRHLTGLRVLGPTEARQKIGDRVDTLVAGCQGKPDCVGAIGMRLGVSEVILVGMSSLGDVIIQITRVKVSSRRVLGSVGHTMPPMGKLSMNKLDSLLRRLMPRRDFIRYGFIRVRSNRRGAQVFLNQKNHGQTPLRGPIKVRAPSVHRVKVSKRGFVDFSADLTVPPDGTVTVNAKLPLIPKGITPFYKKWWFWTVIASSLVTVAGISAGVALTVGKRPESVPAVIRW
jgi:PEGA domain